MIVAVVQARLGSTRFPRKVLADLAGRPALHHVLLRAKAIPGVDRVCCAIPDGAGDDPLAPAAEEVGVKVVRGPEHDVLARYTYAARACDADVVLRITADCPALDPDVCGRAVAAYREGGYDYLSNTDPRSWPKGLDIDVFSRQSLERAFTEGSTPYEREHVTPYIRTAPGYRRGNIALPSDECAGWRWTLDYEEDLAFFRALYGELKGDPLEARFETLKGVVEARPDIAAINAHLV